MKNVTITLDEEIAQWARVEAAKAGKSLSRWIGEKLMQEMAEEGKSGQQRGLKSLLALPLVPLSRNGRLPKKSEYHDRAVFRRYERDRIHAGSKRPTRKGKVD